VLLTAAFVGLPAAARAPGDAPRHTAAHAELPEDSSWVIELQAGALSTGASRRVLDVFVHHPELRAGLAQFTMITGFDPLTDLDAALIHGDPQGNGALLLRGRFDRQHLIALLRQHGQDYRREEAGAATVHSWVPDDQPEQRGYAAFLSDDTLALAHSALSLARAGELLANWQRPSDDDGRVLLRATGALGALAEQLDTPPELPFLARLGQGRLLLREAGAELHCTIALDAGHATRAEQLADMLRGLRALALADRPLPEPLQALLADCTISTDSAQLRVHCSASADALRDLLRQATHEDAPF